MTSSATFPLPAAAHLEAAAWRRSAEELANWAIARLVNRTDIWGGYLPVRYRVPGGSKSVTRPPVALRGQRRLTHALLAAHFGARDPAQIIGTHSTSPANTSLWALADIDSHGGSADAAANERAARSWHERLSGRGFRPLLTKSDERGGFHLRVLFDRAVPTPRVYAFIRRLVSDHTDHGVAEVEVFPKQPRIPTDGCGNWVRLPGLHHSRPVWTRAWDGRRWVGGEHAIHLLLAASGDSPDLIPPDVVAPPPPRPAGVVVTNLPEQPQRCGLASTARERMTDAQVALACLKAIDNSGVGRHYNEWAAIGMILRDIDSGAAMLAEWVAWSAQSDKHLDGVCESKWHTFGRRSGWTLGSLVKWAKDDGTDVFARPAGEERAP